MGPENKPGNGGADLPPKKDATDARGAEYTRWMADIQEGIFATPEFRSVGDWFKERVAALPEMRTSPVPLTDGQNWKHEMTQAGEVDKVTSGFFNVEGVNIEITKPDGTTAGWNQAMVVQQEMPITLPTPEGPITMETSGFVGAIQDERGNMLLTVGQEPGAKGDKSARVRTPFQTSAKKLQALREGDTAKDPNLAGLLNIIGGGRPIDALLASGDIKVFPLAGADENRIDATNVGFSMTVKDEIRDSLTADGRNRWCSPAEVKALRQAGVVNGLTGNVIGVV